jgi:hypothetical protein
MGTPSSEVVRKFRERIAVTIGYHRELLLAVHEKRRQRALESMLAEQFALNTAILWEEFFSDLLKAYVAEDPTHYLRGLRTRVEASTTDKFGATVARHISMDFPSTINPSQAAAWIDPKEFNVTVRSASALASKANALLAAQYARRFSMEHEQNQFIDFSIALRNFLAHRSKSARDILRTSAGALSGANAEFSASLKDIGPYLKFRHVDGDTRAARIAIRMSALAGALI